MHRQRTFLSLATLIASLSFLFKWLSIDEWTYWSGLHTGASGLFSVLCYVGMLIVIIIDITDRTLSKKRLILMGGLTLICFLLMLYRVYSIFWRLSNRNQTFDIMGIGLVTFVCSNLFMLGYCAFSYKNDYILPTGDESVLDENMKF